MTIRATICLAAAVALGWTATGHAQQAKNGFDARPTAAHVVDGKVFVRLSFLNRGEGAFLIRCPKLGRDYSVEFVMEDEDEQFIAPDYGPGVSFDFWFDDFIVVAGTRGQKKLPPGHVFDDTFVLCRTEDLAHVKNGKLTVELSIESIDLSKLAPAKSVSELYEQLDSQKMSIVIPAKRIRELIEEGQREKRHDKLPAMRASEP